MREATARLAAMLEGSRQVTFEANIVRGDVSMDGMPVDLGGSLSWNASQMVEMSGSVRLTIVDEGGESRAPTEAGDLLAPFGSEVMLTCRVAVGDMVERVQLTRARIAKVPAVLADRVNVGGAVRTLAEVVSLDLRDRMDVLLADDFDQDQPVRFPASAWAELEHLSPFPVIRSGDDVQLPASHMHEGNRADAVQVIAARLGGVAAFDSAGNLIVRRPTAAPVLDLVLGPNGTVSEVGAVMSTDGVYNRVVVRGKRADGVPIRVERTAGGALAPAVWGRRTYVADQGDFVRTEAQAAAFADRLLAQVSTVRTNELEVQCLTDPRLELGDVVRVQRQGRAELIAVTKISLTATMMTVTGRVL